MSQNAAILDALKKGDALTDLDALSRFGCRRLAARVADLKARGYPVKSRLVRRGESRVAEYSMYWRRTEATA
jgi:hypothetical protein